MGIFSSVRANIGLVGAATPAGVNSTGTVSIGTAPADSPLSDADILYSFKVTSTGSSDVATLNLATGAITQATGTPEVARRTGGTSDLAALDFEGATLPTAVRINAMLAVADTGNSGSFVSFSGSNTPLGGTVKPGGRVVSVNEWTSPGTCNINFTASGDIVTITVAGQSS